MKNRELVGKCGALYWALWGILVLVSLAAVNSRGATTNVFLESETPPNMEFCYPSGDMPEVGQDFVVKEFIDHTTPDGVVQQIMIWESIGGGRIKIARSEGFRFFPYIKGKSTPGYYHLEVVADNRVWVCRGLRQVKK